MITFKSLRHSNSHQLTLLKKDIFSLCLGVFHCQHMSCNCLFFCLILNLWFKFHWLERNNSEFKIWVVAWLATKTALPSEEAKWNPSSTKMRTFKGWINFSGSTAIHHNQLAKHSEYGYTTEDMINQRRDPPTQVRRLWFWNDFVEKKNTPSVFFKALLATICVSGLFYASDLNFIGCNNH